mmetsp:Transcript_10772/g.49542  ORF Transcript_10772/g.49542 Transcript_10772/m.49542 type:complete len:325 (-) Transcript_10772:645-1619(-)
MVTSGGTGSGCSSVNVCARSRARSPRRSPPARAASSSQSPPRPTPRISRIRGLARSGRSRRCCDDWSTALRGDRTSSTTGRRRRARCAGSRPPSRSSSRGWVHSAHRRRGHHRHTTASSSEMTERGDDGTMSPSSPQRKERRRSSATTRPSRSERFRFPPSKRCWTRRDVTARTGTGTAAIGGCTPCGARRTGPKCAGPTPRTITIECIISATMTSTRTTRRNTRWRPVTPCGTRSSGTAWRPWTRMTRSRVRTPRGTITKTKRRLRRGTRHPLRPPTRMPIRMRLQTRMRRLCPSTWSATTARACRTPTPSITTVCSPTLGPI